MIREEYTKDFDYILFYLLRWVVSIQVFITLLSIAFNISKIFHNALFKYAHYNSPSDRDSTSLNCELKYSIQLQLENYASKLVLMHKILDIWSQILKSSLSIVNFLGSESHYQFMTGLDSHFTGPCGGQYLGYVSQLGERRGSSRAMTSN